MKTRYIVLATILAFTTPAMAQVEMDTTTATATDTATNEDVEVVISPKAGQDSTIVKVGDMKIIVLNSDKSKSGEKIIIDREIEISDTIDKHDKEDKNVSHWAGIRLGVNGYLHKGGLSVPATHDFLELDYAKSLSVDLNLLEKDFKLCKQYVELVTGLGLHFANYRFKNQYATLTNTDPLSAVIDSTRILTKNTLRATYVTAPLLLGFSTNKSENKALRFATGAQVSWRIGSKLKQEFSRAGDTVKPRVRSDFDLTPFLFHAVASVGYGPINVYANYALNPLFESNKTLTIMPFDVGLQLMF